MRVIYSYGKPSIEYVLLQYTCACIMHRFIACIMQRFITYTKRLTIIGDSIGAFHDVMQVSIAQIVMKWPTLVILYLISII